MSTYLEAFTEAHRLGVSRDEGMILGVVAEIGPARSCEILKRFPNKTINGMSTQLCRLVRRGLLTQKKEGRDWPAYGLTSKAEKWKP